MARQERIPLVISADGQPLYIADCTLDEGHSASARVTDHPVERGAAITDHVQIEPRELRATVFTSTTPLFGGIPGEGRERAAWETLVGISRARRLVTVTTSLESYDSMILYKVEAPRSARDGQSVSVALTFRQIELTNTLAIQTPPGVLRALIRPGGKTKDNTKPGDGPEKPDTKVARKRLLSSARDGIGAIVKAAGGE